VESQRRISCESITVPRVCQKCFAALAVMPVWHEPTHENSGPHRTIGLWPTLWTLAAPADDCEWRSPRWAGRFTTWRRNSVSDCLSAQRRRWIWPRQGAFSSGRWKNCSCSSTLPWPARNRSPRARRVTSGLARAEARRGSSLLTTSPHLRTHRFLDTSVALTNAIFSSNGLHSRFWYGVPANQPSIEPAQPARPR